MDFARSVAHLSILNPGAPTGCTDNTLGGSDVVWKDMEILYTTGYISNLGKKSPLCALNATGGQITVKSIKGLWFPLLEFRFFNVISYHFRNRSITYAITNSIPQIILSSRSKNI